MLYKKMVEPVLEIRHSTVHHYLLKTQHYWKHTEHHMDLEQLKKDYTEKIGYWNELKEQFLHCLDGYKKTLALIKILPDK
jgi:ABC-type lipoprotein release transport system permease subunit